MRSSKRHKHSETFVSDIDGSFGSLSINPHLICYLYENNSDLITSMPVYSGMKNIKIVSSVYIQGLCSSGMSKPYLNYYLDTLTSTIFILDEIKLEDYAITINRNRVLALATHPMVLEYVRTMNPKDLQNVMIDSDNEIRSFISGNITINILIKRGIELKQLN